MAVDGFWIDLTPVTNRQFAAFIEATGYTIPRTTPACCQAWTAGSMVFHKSKTPVDTSNPANWWAFEFGADWRHPLGPDSDVESLGLWDHPVVQIAYVDAEAYAQWAGKNLPTEAEFEYAARGRLEGADYAGETNWRPAGR